MHTVYCLNIQWDYLLLVLLVSPKVPNSLSLGFVSVQVLNTSWICHRNLPLCVSSVTRVGLILLWEIFQDSQAVLTEEVVRATVRPSTRGWAPPLVIVVVGASSSSSFPSVVRWPPRRRHLPILLLEVEDMLGRRLLGWRWCGGGRSSAKTSEKWLQWCETTDVMSELWWWKDNFYEEDEGDLKKNRQDVYFRPQWGWHRDCNKGLYYLFTQNSKKTWAALKGVHVQSFFFF